MGGTVITLSPRMPLADTERVVRGRLERDGQVAVAGKDERQARQLRRLAGRLRDGPAVEVRLWRGQADGVTYLTVARPGQGVSWWGAPKVGGPRAELHQPAADDPVGVEHSMTPARGDQLHSA